MNIIPTLLFLLMQLYWIIAIIGLFDFDFLDFDLEGAEGVGPVGAIAIFINIGKVPIALAYSLLVLNFWILSMLLYFLPIEAGGFMNGLLLIPAFVVSVFITKYEVQPLKKIFQKRKRRTDIDQRVLKKRCRLLCDLEVGRLGQAEVEHVGAPFVINVMPFFDEETFEKNDIAFVFSKDDEKDVYYIAKSLVDDEYLSLRVKE